MDQGTTPRTPASSGISESTSAPTSARGGVFVGAPTSSISGRGSRGIAFFQDAFRPFYLGGAIFAALAVPLWLGMWYHGYVTPSLTPLYWHMHEMVFGFVAAIIVGFLFTAARNWTGLPLPAGAVLAGVFLLWVAGRVGMFFAYGKVVAAVDSAFLLLVAGVLASKFIRARSVSSFPLVVVLLGLGLSNVAFHASMQGLIRGSPMAAIEFGLMLVVMIEMIVGGRVVPGFTASAIPGVRQWRWPWLNRLAFAGAAATFVCDGLQVEPRIAGAVAMTAAVLVAVQAAGWNPLATRSRPMLWVLHLAYAGIPVGLCLLGLASFGVASRSAAIHAFAAGSMGGLIIGMITRTALGHSGHPVRAGRAEITAYVLVLLAAVIRVSAALVPSIYAWGMLGAGLAWSAGFLIYAIAYAPILLRARE
ncbi:hypothetical protein PHYC_00105 [Phycisphaerales bacterium]|nr:hypothetical protein PHYC_00105 [Phycisphaerales bacterium]